MMSHKKENPEKPRFGGAGRYVYFAFFPAAILFMEIVIRFYCFGVLFYRGLFYLLMFSIPAGLVIALLGGLWRKKANFAIAALLLFAVTLVFCVQAVYYTVFSTFFTLYSFVGTGEVLRGFGSGILTGIRETILPLIILFIPLFVLLISGKRLAPMKRPSARFIIGALAIAAAAQLTGLAVVKSSDLGIMSDDYVYSESFSPILSVPRFGVLTTLRLDIHNILSYKAETSPPQSSQPPPASNTPEVSPTRPAQSSTGGEESRETPASGNTVPEYNVLEIDFDSLSANAGDADIAAMHAYFASVPPTQKNEYTGMFEGYNLVWIVAEGFSSLALEETHTPTLCRLASEGFVFNNFYNPVWGVSTSDGEYVATTGLLPKSGVWSYYKSSYNYMPFGFGNMFSKLGYTARAYHGHTYTYYNRDKSYPNMGYDYKGVGSGLDIKKQWPESDVEVIEATVPEYIGDESFLVYYMSISGHMNYNFVGNMMAYKHKDDVADLPYSEAARAYIACQMEFDQSMKLLLDKLDQAGVLDHTVIVISGDHYPYGLKTGEMEELKGETIEENFELFRSTLIIWNPAIKTVQVDKYCSSLDIMPTLANLFGLDYDSRLVMGSDILSDSDPLVIFNNQSFIAKLGRYNSKTNEFTPDGAAAVPDGYAKDIFSQVKDKFKYSALILEKDYYGIVFGKK